MIVYLSNKNRFRTDSLSSRIVKSFEESFLGRIKLTGTRKKS